MPFIICVVSLGREKGKTSLVEQLTNRFTCEGIKVATVKHIHGSFDTAEKDTWRHLEAGAEITVAATSTELVSIRRKANPPIEEALKAIYIDSQLVLVEGYKSSSFPKILQAGSFSEVDSAMKEVTNIIIVSGSIAEKADEKENVKKQFPELEVYLFEEIVIAVKELLEKEILKELPGLNCKHCGYDSCLSLAKAFLEGETKLEECKVLSEEVATLKVDGRVVPLGKFPQEILRGTIIGLLGSLKGVGDNPNSVEIKLKI